MGTGGHVESALRFLAGCAGKATILFALAWIAAILMQKQSAAVRHRVWAVGILSALTLPVCTMCLPAWHSNVLAGAAALWAPGRAIAESSSAEKLPAMVVNAATVSPWRSETSGVLLLIWAMGAAIFVAQLVGGLVRLLQESAHMKRVHAGEGRACAAEICSTLKITRPVRLVESGNSLAMPITWGIFRPVVMLPSSASEWPDTRRRAVLLHEFAHVARYDWFLQLCSELVRSLYWFHPLAWMAARKLRQESERACDDAVLNCGVDARDYAGQLLDLARTLANADRSWSAGLAIARISTLERRFIAMLNPTMNRGRLSRRAGMLTTLVTLCFLIPFAALRLPAQGMSASFAGTIHDPSGAAVRNATIIMTNQKSNTITMTVSDGTGKFAFKALPSGEYEMKVEKKGFETYRAPRVALESGGEVSQNVTLEVSGTAEDVEVVAKRSGAAAGSSGSAIKVPRVKLGGDVQAAKILEKKIPVYPEEAKAAGVQGTVMLHAVIGMDGKPESLRVMNEQIDPELARAALEAVSQWRYQPTLLNGQPIEVDTTIMVNFSLQP